MAADIHSVETIARAVDALADAASPAEVFKALLEASRAAGPRASVYLVRQGRIRGWGAAGFPAEATAALRRHEIAMDDGWLGRIASTATVVEDGGGGVPSLGQPVPAAAAGVALRVGGRAIALVVLERGAAEPWAPELLSAFARVAQLRLELDLARRRIAAAAPQATPAGAAAGEPVPPAVPLPVAAASSPHTDLETSVEPLGVAAAPALTADPGVDEDLDRARRYARLVATDIRLYNEEAVTSGRRQGDLLARLGDQLGRGREAFLRRHGDLGPTALDVLHEAWVEILAGGDAALIPRSALD